MAIKPTDTVAGTGALFKIEELAQKADTPAYVLAGIKAANGWGSGKELTEAAYKTASEKFLKGSMTGGVKNG